jgi:hypothetical protein
MQFWNNQLCDPEPDPLHDVPWLAFWPDNRVQRSFTRVQIGLTRLDEVRTFDDTPEEIEAEVDGDTDVLFLLAHLAQNGIGCWRTHIDDETLIIKSTSNSIEAIEEDDQTKEDCCSIRQIRLERRLERERATIDALRLRRVVEANIRDADRHPGEEGGDGGEVLEPREDRVGAGGAGHVGQESN